MNILERKIDTLTQIVIDCCIEKNNSKSYISQTPYTMSLTSKKKKKRKPSSRRRRRAIPIAPPLPYISKSPVRPSAPPLSYSKSPVRPSAPPLSYSIPIANVLGQANPSSNFPVAPLVYGGKRKRKTKKRKYRKRKRKTKKRKYRKRK